MTELQQIELEMLKEFLRICSKLNLTYYLVCGSALGAVKYSGFIPWDDDMDVALPRQDYEIFMRKAQLMLPQHLFLQNNHTDPAYPHIYSKLRNSETTYVEKSSAQLPINHGVYIDIFPLDGYPNDLKMQQNLERRKLKYKRQLACVFDIERHWKSKVLCVWNRMIGCPKRTLKIVDDYSAMISAYPIDDSALICNHGNWQGKLEYAPREQYGNGIMMKFEGLDVRVPEKYDEYLTQKYGDWRADLPPEQQVGHHYYTVCDLTKPYTYYMKK